MINQNSVIGDQLGNLKNGDHGDGRNLGTGVKSVSLENKKRRTDSGIKNVMGFNIEIQLRY